MIEALARPGRWLDLSSTGHPLTWYQAVHAAGYQGVILDLETPQWANDYHNALEAGLGVLLNQGYWAPYWQDLSQATLRGAYAASQAKSVGYPTTSPIFLDCEAMGALDAPETLAWINAWNSAVIAGGYDQCGVYVGANVPLDGTQWYGIPKTSHYWKSASAVPLVAVRGYQIVQTAVGQMFQGVAVDYDTVGVDALHGEPLAAVSVVTLPAPTISTSTDWKPAVDALTARVTTLESQNAALQAQIQQAGKALQG